MIQKLTTWSKVSLDPMNFYFRNIILYTSFIYILLNIFIKSSWFEKNELEFNIEFVLDRNFKKKVEN